MSGDGGPDLDDGYFTIVLNTNPYTYLGNRPLDLSPARDASIGVSSRSRSRTMKAATSSTSLAGALRAAACSPPIISTSAPTSNDCVIEHDTPFPYQLDGDALGETNRLEFVHVPDAVRLVFPTLGREPPVARSPDAPSSATSGTSVHTPSTPRSASSTRRAGSLQVQVLTVSPTA